ncbi:MAG: heparinase II/III family protein [Candidatus Saccharibacteria bacterium]|nr:heparinase II/III family protein [Rhodoferax sp.]
MRLRSWAEFPKALAISVLVAGLVGVSIWLPELAHWYVRPAQLTSTAVDRARTAPSQDVLNEVAAMHLGAVSVNPGSLVSIADQILRGSLSLPGFAPMPLTLPFSENDLVRGLPTFQLAVASLVSADILLDAYRASGHEAYFQQAREVIVSFAHHEGAQWVDQGLMWNDHAIAARTPVLVKFWLRYRVHPSFDPVVGQTILNLVSRSSQLLVKPSFYAWRTGHGIVSNAALLQMTVAFPELPDVAHIRRIAAERFSRHLTYWINEEGVTLLHSAGYHSPGLFGMVLRLHTLNGIRIPEAWWTRYAKTLAFDVQLRRPDDTLPMFGDTLSTPRQLGMITARNHSDDTAGPLSARMHTGLVNTFASYPVAGHAIWWDGLTPSDPTHATAAQTVVTWSYHPGLGHKMADELSMVLWAGGRTWLTNAGYWPYGMAGRDDAESWGASNAPHILGETKYSERHSRLRSLGQGGGVSFIDLERVGPAGYTIRRQIIRLANHHSWVVLDQSLDSAAQKTTTHWTLYPDLLATQLAGDGQYQVVAPGSRWGMQLSFVGSPGLQTSLASGQKSPFSGWVVMDRTPTPASTIVVTQPSQDSWSLATLTLTAHAGDGDPLPAARMANWKDADHWMAVVPTPSGEMTLTRDGYQILLRQPQSLGNEAMTVMGLEPQAAPVAELQAVREGVQWASGNYKKFRELISYRVEITQWLLAILIGQELVFFLLRSQPGRVVRAIRLTSWFGWAMGGMWLSQVYLTVPH